MARTQKIELTNGEKKIRNIGGALYSDYLRISGVVDTINKEYFPLFDLLGFRSPEHTETVINILLNDNIIDSAKEAYIERITEKINSGQIGIEKVLSKHMLSKVFPTPEERKAVLKREIHRALSFRYKEIEKYFINKYGFPITVFYKLPINICRESLSLTSEGFVIDEDKFVEVYGDYLEANGSQTAKHHQEAAEAINRLFNGNVEITEEELKRYFVIKDGVIKPNPKAINRESYVRLGYSGKPKVNKI